MPGDNTFSLVQLCSLILNQLEHENKIYNLQKDKDGVTETSERKQKIIGNTKLEVTFFFPDDESVTSLHSMRDHRSLHVVQNVSVPLC